MADQNRFISNERSRFQSAHLVEEIPLVSL